MSELLYEIWNETKTRKVISFFAEETAREWIQKQQLIHGANCPVYTLLRTVKTFKELSI